MSRIGRLPIAVPSGTTVIIQDNKVSVTGPKGTLTRVFHPAVTIKQEDSKLTVARESDSREHRALHGLCRSLLANMVEGVTKGYARDLEIVGVGYRAEKAGNKLALRVGQSHPMEFDPPAGISFELTSPIKIKVVGVDKEMVGEVAAQVRGLRPPDSYKGKGIRYAGEVVRLKPGKAGKVAKK